MTTFVAPMLAKSIDEFPHARQPAAGWVYEPKVDGERMGLVIEGGQTAAAYTRRGRQVLDDTAYRWMRGIAWPVAAAYFDGEAYPGDGRSCAQATSNAAQSTAGVPLSLALFDVLAIDGHPTTALPFEQRRALLETCFAASWRRWRGTRRRRQRWPATWQPSRRRPKR